MSKKIFVFLSLLLIASMALAACAPAATPAPTTAPEATAPPAATQPPAAGGTLKVAILAPLSGSVATFGASTRDGAQLAIDEWNAKGGVLGMQIEADIQDSQCTPDPAVNAANKVIDQDKVHYIVGEVCSKASIPVSLIAEEKHVIQISPTSTNDQLTLNADGSTKQYVFRACYNDSFQGVVTAKFALDNLGKKAFIMYDQGNDYTVGLSASFEKAFTDGGGTIVGKETYTSADTDFSAILAKVAEAAPDVVFLGDYYNIVNLVYAQAKEKGITAPFIGGDGWDSSDLDLKAADGGYYSNHYSPEDQRPIVQDWLAKYKAKYNKVPDALATLAYDATNMLLTAIKNAGVDDTSKVKDAMAALQWDGVSGKITFNAQHNPVKAAVILQVKDGAVKYVSTVQP